MYFVLPLGRRFGGALLGTASFPHDAILNAGILEWGYQSLWSPQRRFFDWTAGFPLRNSLAVTENLIGWQLLYTPLRAAGATVAAAYNSLVVTSFIVSGAGTAALARWLGADRYGGLAAGLIFAFTPFHLVHALHLQTLGVCWSPLALLFLDRLLSQGRRIDAHVLATVLVLTALSAVYFGIFLSALLPLYVLLSFAFRRHPPRRAALKILAIDALCAAAVLLPLALPYLHLALDQGYRHPTADLVKLSVHPVGFVSVPPWQAAWAWTGWVRNGEDAAFPGAVATVLALAFCRRAIADHRLRPLALTLAGLALLCALLSLGPVFEGGKRIGLPSIPLPGQVFRLGGIRWPARILFYSVLAGAVMSGLGLTVILGRVDAGVRRSAAWIILMFLTLEYWPLPWYARRSVDVSAPLETSDAYPFLARESDRGAIVELPGADRSGYRTPAMVRYIYGSAGHLRRIVAVHGQVRLPAVDRLQLAAEQLPSETARKLLVDAGVTRLVVHRKIVASRASETIVGKLDGAGYPCLFRGNEGVVFALAFPL